MHTHPTRKQSLQRVPKTNANFTTASHPMPVSFQISYLRYPLTSFRFSLRLWPRVPTLRIPLDADISPWIDAASIQGEILASKGNFAPQQPAGLAEGETRTNQTPFRSPGAGCACRVQTLLRHASCFAEFWFTVLYLSQRRNVCV